MDLSMKDPSKAVNEFEEIALPEYSFNEEALHRHLQMYNCLVPQGLSQLNAPMVYTFPPNQPSTPPPAYTPNSVEQEHTSPDTQQQQGPTTTVYNNSQWATNVAVTRQPTVRVVRPARPVPVITFLAMVLTMLQFSICILLGNIFSLFCCLVACRYVKKAENSADRDRRKSRKYACRSIAVNIFNFFFWMIVIAIIIGSVVVSL